jgi:hypothetical protein
VRGITECTETATALAAEYAERAEYFKGSSISAEEWGDTQRSFLQSLNPDRNERDFLW